MDCTPSARQRRGEAEGNARQPSTLRTPSREGVTAGLDRGSLRPRRRVASREAEEEGAVHRASAPFGRRSAAVGLFLAQTGCGGGGGRPDVGRIRGCSGSASCRSARPDHRGSYRTQPSLRQYIPKPDGRQRPLGVAAVEDKVVQRAMVEVLSAIWEEDFLGFSYGFRPARSQHDALDASAVAIEKRPVNWMLDCDISGFFDMVNHEWLRRFVEHRIGHPRVIRLIRKRLKAGVMEDGQVIATETGTPQGAVISPLLANLYLHHVFDLWADRRRRREATGAVIIVCGACPRAGQRPEPGAEDIVVGFQHQADAERFKADLTERPAAFALTLHPDKTRLIESGRHAAIERAWRGLGRPETFEFLGFPHICALSRAGRFQLRQRKRRDRMRAKLRGVRDDLWRFRHAPLDEQGAWSDPSERRRNATRWVDRRAAQQPLPALCARPLVRAGGHPSRGDVDCASLRRRRIHPSPRYREGQSAGPEVLKMVERTMPLDPADLIETPEDVAPSRPLLRMARPSRSRTRWEPSRAPRACLRLHKRPVCRARRFTGRSATTP
jgi:RNA-directed DNA polymerase